MKTFFPPLRFTGLLLLAGGGLLLFPDPCRAVEVVGTATVRVLAPLTVTAENELDFGYFEASSVTGYVTVAATGGRTVSDGVSMGATEAFSPARFTISGSANQNYVVVTPTAVSFSGLAVGEFTTYSSVKMSSGHVGALGADGKDTLSVGGRLSVSPTTPSGSYKGAVTVSVAYQ